jgi:hypothetical protein
MSSDFALSVPAWKSDALSLFQRLLPASFLEPFEKHKRQNNRVYTFLVVMWLLIAQRLQPLASLETAVLELLRGLPSTFWPQPCQRVQDWRHGRKSLSSHTGAYNTPAWSPSGKRTKTRGGRHGPAAGRLGDGGRC